MKQLLSEIETAVNAECARASNKFGAYHNSAHESYAVILEEFDEAMHESRQFAEELRQYWKRIKANDNNAHLNESLGWLRICAKKAAAEWVQVAAMADKALRTIERGGE